jgi:hypothetical protein
MSNITYIPTRKEIDARKKKGWGSGKFAAMMLTFFPEFVENLYAHNFHHRYNQTTNGSRQSKDPLILTTLEDVARYDYDGGCEVSGLEVDDDPPDPNQDLREKGHEIYGMLTMVQSKIAHFGYEEAYDYVSKNKELHMLWLI